MAAGIYLEVADFHAILVIFTEQDAASYIFKCAVAIFILATISAFRCARCSAESALLAGTVPLWGPFVNSTGVSNLIGYSRMYRNDPSHA